MAANDPNYADNANGRGAMLKPIAHAFAVSPHDSNELAFVTRGILLGTAGDVKLTTSGGDTVTIKNLAAGVVHPFRVRKVFATGTTAADITGVY